MALRDSACYGLENREARLSCFTNKALVNVGTELAKMVPGRVSTEVDARLAYDTQEIVNKVHDLRKLYDNVGVPPERVLFKIPSTWQDFEASRLLESEEMQTHLTFFYSFAQAAAAAAAQAGASDIQIFVGHLRDWTRHHSGDPEVAAAVSRGEDPGLALVTKSYNYIHKNVYKSKLMAAAVRNKQDLFSLIGFSSPAVPESIMSPNEKFSFVRRLSPQSANTYNFSQEDLIKWDQRSLAAAIGPASVDLLASAFPGYMSTRPSGSRTCSRRSGHCQTSKIKASHIIPYCIPCSKRVTHLLFILHPVTILHPYTAYKIKLTWCSGNSYLVSIFYFVGWLETKSAEVLAGTLPHITHMVSSLALH